MPQLISYTTIPPHTDCAQGERRAAAQNVRDNESGDFQSAEKELVEAVDTLSRAIVIIKREMSFAQGKCKFFLVAGCI